MKKLKRIKLFFIAIFSVCLWLTSFSSAWSVEVPFNLNDSRSTTFWSSFYFYVPIDTINLTWYTNSFVKSVSVCINFDDISSVFLDYYWFKPSLTNFYISSPTSNYSMNIGYVPLSSSFTSFNSLNFSNWVYQSICSNVNFNVAAFSSSFFRFQLNSNDSVSHTSSTWFYLSWTISFTSNYIVENVWWSLDCSQDSNYLQCLEDKNQLIWQVSTLSWGLSSCQSDLSDCMWWQDASLLACIDQKEQCESSLNTLSWNYASLENMNSSLSSQLQECLESWGWSWSSDLICNTFDLFWDSDNTRYSFPINNNLILPVWYKGFVNEWVLAIKQDNNYSYSIDDEDFQKVMDSYWVVFLYLFGWALFLMFLFVIRKYFIWLKS